MKKAIERLEERRNQIIERLKAEENEYLSELQEIDKAMNWLKKIEELNLEIVQKYDVVELPDMTTGYSGFRVMNDCETDDIRQWVELRKDDHPVCMAEGDILIIRKP